MTTSRLITGVVAHARHRPRLPRLRYRMFQLLLDLDEIGDMDANLGLFSVNRFNLISFHATDHLDPCGPPLRAQVETLLDAAGIAAKGGSIRLLAMPRVLGNVFNPLSLFLCRNPDGDLAAILYEVRNTFGEHHVYVLPVEPRSLQTEPVRQYCAKQFFVSPFMPMALRYAFEVLDLPEQLDVTIQVSDDDGEIMRASFRGRPANVSDLALLRAWAGAPLLSLKVLGAIHWEALLLWCKGVRLQVRQPAPHLGVTLGDTARSKGAAQPRAS